MYKVKFGDVNLHDYCHVMNVTRDIAPPRSNLSKSIPAINGSYYTGFKYGERIITIEIGWIEKSKVEYMDKVSKLADILNVHQPLPLIIDDEPYKMYFAVPDGQTNIGKFSTSGKCEINFKCFDPLAYSLYWNSYWSVEKTLKLMSYGNVETYPVVDVDFTQDACFFQLTNPKGETVLVGQPKRATEETKKETDVVEKDLCQTVDGFGPLAQSLLDPGRLVTGKYDVGIEGEAIICTNYGTPVEGSWTGTSFKKQLPMDLLEFDLDVHFSYVSRGANYSTPQPQLPVPQPSVPQPPGKPNNDTKTPSSDSLGTYEVVNCGGLWINRTADTSQPMYAMAPGTYIYPEGFYGNWVKHTHSNRWNTFTGYSHKNYLRKVSSGKVTKTSSIDDVPRVMPKEFDDEQLGLIEIYGFDKNGGKIFKFVVKDTNPYYEYTEPEMYIGRDLVLSDGKNVPTPRKENVVDDKGNVTEVKDMPSGAFGDFNDMDGRFSIKREINSKGEQLWTCSVSKIVQSKPIWTVNAKNTLSSPNYPKTELSYLGFYIGRYGSYPPTEIMGVSHILCKKVNFKTDEVFNGNVSIFKKDDHLQIDHQNGLVLLNDKPILNHIDIGSEFFSIPPGNSQVAWRSDDTNAKVVLGFRDRFI